MHVYFLLANNAMKQDSELRFASSVRLLAKLLIHCSKPWQAWTGPPLWDRAVKQGVGFLLATRWGCAEIARGLALSLSSSIFRHLHTHSISPVWVATTLGLGAAATTAQ
jgi:hypothetical protein